MFRKLNLYLFAGFVLSLKIAILVALIYGLCLAVLTPFTGGEFLVTAVPMIMGIVAMVTFPCTLLAFFLVMSAKIWGAEFNPQSEGYWVLSVAALTANIWLVSGNTTNYLGIYALNMVVSVAVILIGNKLYHQTKIKLERLIALEGRNPDQ